MTEGNNQQTEPVTHPNEDDIFMVGYGGWVMIKRHERGTPYRDFDLDDGDEDMFMQYATEGTVLQVLSASVTKQTNLPTVSSYYLPFHDGYGNTDEEFSEDMLDGSEFPDDPYDYEDYDSYDDDTREEYDNGAKSQIRLGKGTYTFSGEISFELTLGALKEFFHDDFFKRDTLFTVSFFDGQNVCLLVNCVWSNIQIQCSPNSLVTVSISYQSNNGYVDDLQIIKYEIETMSYNERDLLIPYWTCGHDGFQEFSISFERPVTPVFLNGSLNVASYIRPGLITVSLSATTIEYFESWDERLDICLGSDNNVVVEEDDGGEGDDDEDGEGDDEEGGEGGDDEGGDDEEGEEEESAHPSEYGVTFLKSVLQSCQYSMSSMSDTGAKTYTWNSISTDARHPVFEIWYNNKNSEEDIP